MKRFKLLLIMAFLLGLVSIAEAQETISPRDAAKYIGETKTVCGTVASAHYATRSKGNPPSLILANLIRIRFSQCSFGDRTGAILKRRPNCSILGKRFVSQE